MRRSRASKKLNKRKNPPSSHCREMSTKKLFTGRESDLPSAAAEKIGGNQDLIREILVYVPARSLLRFKSVSKQWFHLIVDPQFGRHHSACRSPSSFVPSGLYFYNSLTTSRDVETVSLLNSQSIQNQPSRVPSISFPELPQCKVKVVQSCNGLCVLCIASVEDSAVNIYCLYNPTTRKLNVLPRPDLVAYESVVGCSLAFDPLKSPHYKVVWVKKLPNDSCNFVLYSSGTGNWTTSSDCSLDRYWCSRTKFDNGVYWNGAIHWLRHSDADVYSFSINFEVDATRLRIVNLPPMPPSGRERFRYFGECNGYLHLVYVRSRYAIKFNVLGKDKETENWSVKYRVHLSRLISAFPEIVIKFPHEHGEETQYAFSILCVVKGEKEEDSALVLTIPGKVISYNFMTKTSKVLSELPSQVVDTSPFHPVSAYQYIESLSPV